MATLPTRSWITVVQNITAGIQGRASALIDFSTGSPLLAIAEAYAGVSMWLQGIILQLLNVTRLATSSGTDVDTFCFDFMPIVAGSNVVGNANYNSALPNGSPRLGATYATGTATYSRYTAAASAPFIPVGSTLKTTDGTQSFIVVANAANSAYSATLGGYTMPSSVSSVTVSIQAVNPGVQGNVSAGAIAVNTSTIVGVDTVANSAATSGGVNQESDAQLKARFFLYILGLSAANYYGVMSAVSAVQVGTQATVTELYTYGGAYNPGTFYVVCDNGSGAPPSSFVSGVSAAVQSKRALGIMASTYAATTTYANYSMTLTTATGYTHSVVVAQVVAAIAAYINSLGLGNGLPKGQLYAQAFSVAGVTDVQSVLLNGGTSDIAANPQATIKVGTATVA